MIDKETFLKGLTPERVLDLPGLGDVRVRGLTRSEAVSLSEVKGDTKALECRIVALGLVEPALTAAEIEAWYETSTAGYAQLIISAVEDLSGMAQGAQKSGVPEVRGRQRP